MTNAYFSLLLLTAITISPVQAQSTVDQKSTSKLVVSTGAVGGGYWGAGERLAAVAAEKGMSVEVSESSGSKENIALLMDPQSPVTLAFAQADAIQLYLKRKPDAGKHAEVLENIGEECVYILTDANGKLEDLDDMADEAKNLTVFISSETSGSAATYDSMVELVPDLRDAKVRYGDTAAAIEGLLNSTGSSNAVMVVHKPRAHSSAVDAAIANPDKIQFVELQDDDLQATMPSGESVYRSMRMNLPGAEKPVNTVCVKGYLLVNKAKLPVDELAQLTDLVSFNWMRVYATP